jgi:hypothetical protein
MPPPVSVFKKAADNWLRENRKKRFLARTLYMVPGLADEKGSCWQAICDDLGPATFADWDRFARPLTFDEEGLFPNGSIWAGQPMRTFFEFGDLVREEIAQAHPDHGSNVGEFDLLAHSMGGLSAFAALTSKDQPATAMAFNFIACDTPFRGIPNADARKKFADMNGKPFRQSQCDAIDELKPQFTNRLLQSTPALIDRIERLACLRADRPVYVAVKASSSDLLRDPDLFPSRDQWLEARREVRYRSLPVPGATHSGPDGLTNVRVGVVEIFRTLLGEV